MTPPAEKLWMESFVSMAAGQFLPSPDKDANVRRMDELAAQAHHRGASIVVFPEYSMYFNRQMGSDFVANAEPIDGPFVGHLAQIAAKYHLHVVAGMGESVGDSAHVWNTVVAVSPSGDVVSTYRKIHLFDAFGSQESDWVAPGETDQSTGFEVAGVSVGLQTCYDLRFPEVTRQVVDAGAEIVLVPAQWVPGPLKEHHWATLIQARAIENTVYILAADQAAPLAIGRSMIVDPMGVVLASSGPEEGIISADIEVAKIAAVRANNPALQLRRFDVVPRAMVSAK